MEKLEYILYCWSQYVRSNRIIGIYLLILAAAILLWAFIIQAKQANHTKLISESIQAEIKNDNFISWIAYCVFATILLIIPFAALLLVQFQTVFYSYSTLWVIATILPLIAFSLSFLMVLMKKQLSRIKFIIVSISILIILLLCGNLGRSTDDINSIELIRNPVSYEASIPLLDRLNEHAKSTEYNGKVTILAPMNVTAYSHMYSANIKTLYGKDMWDTSMAPLTYNEYPEEYCNLYTWINCIESFGTFYNIDEQTPGYTSEINITYEEYDELIENGKALGGKAYFKLARECGVDIIVIYAYTARFDYDEFNYLVESLELKQEYVAINDNEGYILLFLR